ncbi:unnamed protein product [marine sediment metagenome]|uniref:PRTRC system protein B n=1 Tax=marine sediment metagenome TaxID=412755 RepID=X1VEI4_9ZZZZ
MTNEKPANFEWAVPEKLGIPPDPLRLRLDFHHQAVVMTNFKEETTTRKVVSAMDIAHALASELSFGTGLLPDRTLWWQNTKGGPVVALYVEPQVRLLSLQMDAGQPPRRFKVPLPGLIFLCRPGTPPWVYAVKKKPTKETDAVYKAPLANVFSSGRTCPGSHKFPMRIRDIVESFFMSFFSATADLYNRSNKFPKDVILLWAYLDKKKRFPKEDLVAHGTVRDLMEMEK